MGSKFIERRVSGLRDQIGRMLSEYLGPCDCGTMARMPDHTAAIAEAAREWRAALDAVQAEESGAIVLLEVAEEALAAAVDAERAGREGERG